MTEALQAQSSPTYRSARAYLDRQTVQYRTGSFSRRSDSPPLRLAGTGIVSCWPRAFTCPTAQELPSSSSTSRASIFAALLSISRAPPSRSLRLIFECDW